MIEQIIERFQKTNEDFVLSFHPTRGRGNHFSVSVQRWDCEKKTWEYKTFRGDHCFDLLKESRGWLDEYK